MYIYEYHIEQIPAALKTARRAAIVLRDDDGNEIGQRSAHDYTPAQGWILVLSADTVLKFHHDKTEQLLALLLPISEDEDLEGGGALLYKVSPARENDNVRATRQVGAAAVRRIQVAISEGRLTNER